MHEPKLSGAKFVKSEPWLTEARLKISGLHKNFGPSSTQGSPATQNGGCMDAAVASSSSELHTA